MPVAGETTRLTVRTMTSRGPAQLDVTEPVVLAGMIQRKARGAQTGRDLGSQTVGLLVPSVPCEAEIIDSLGAFRGQKGARPHGNAGIPGNVVSVTYRI